MVGQIYPIDLQVNNSKANSIDSEAPFLDLDWFTTDGIASSKKIETGNFSFFDRDVPPSPSYGVYFAAYSFCTRVCSYC